MDFVRSLTNTGFVHMRSRMAKDKKAILNFAFRPLFPKMMLLNGNRLEVQRVHYFSPCSHSEGQVCVSFMVIWKEIGKILFSQKTADCGLAKPGVSLGCIMLSNLGFLRN